MDIYGFYLPVNSVSLLNRYSEKIQVVKSGMKMIIDSKKSPHSLSVTQAQAQIAAGNLSVNTLLEACLAQITQQEPHIQAWSHLAIASARQQASLSNLHSDSQAQVLPLQGIPIAVKDIFATPDMPTSWGSPMYRGRILDHEATVVTRLKAAGAIIVGKTITTEFATAAPGPTRNPHHLDHTPGGSSSGSAAAVAAQMVPLAIGSQTLGSVLRPAAYCGIFGFKPSFGLISRYGMLSVCRDLDQVGFFARSLTDLPGLLAVLAGPDPLDPDCIHSLSMDSRFNRFAPPRLAPPRLAPPRLAPPRLAYVLTADADQLEPVARDRLDRVATILIQAGATIDRVTLPPMFDPAWEIAQTLCAVSLATNHGDVISTHADHCSEGLKAWVNRGHSTAPLRYTQAHQQKTAYLPWLQTLFSQYDAILAPVTTGAAPRGLDNTGSPIFCSLWTLCGLPALNLPVGTNDVGLPLGCQLIGPPQQDHHLLQIAQWIWPYLSDSFGGLPYPSSLQTSSDL